MPRPERTTPSARLLNVIGDKLREVLEAMLPRPELEPEPIPARVQDRR